MTHTDDSPPSDPAESPARSARRDARFALDCLLPGDPPDFGAQEDLLDSLAHELLPVRCPPRTVLCRRDHRPDGVAFIQDGIVELVTGPRDVVTQTLCRGDVLGLEELISGRTAPRLARAASHVSYLFLPTDPLLHAFLARPGAAPHLMSGLADRLVTTSGRLATVLEGDVEQRTARMLLLEERNGVLVISQSALAAMAGISRPSLNRALKALSDRNAVQLQYRRIRILDESLLRAAATADRWSSSAPGDGLSDAPHHTPDAAIARHHHERS
ncbi:Crp/Fnr family transcriptional regulator [Amycolatopsis sp. NPDC004169]|uniref:Crp/Fnr family transcriptional regulator n=1 Tax=Amycolatopsis sp. NPDC004169 TaxID=3154453 RepID=UPI0033A43DB9